MHHNLLQVTRVVGMHAWPGNLGAHNSSHIISIWDHVFTCARTQTARGIHLEDCKMLSMRLSGFHPWHKQRSQAIVLAAQHQMGLCLYRTKTQRVLAASSSLMLMHAVNVVQHTYWNMSGHDSGKDILDHQVRDRGWMLGQCLFDFLSGCCACKPPI